MLLRFSLNGSLYNATISLLLKMNLHYKKTKHATVGNINTLNSVNTVTIDSNCVETGCITSKLLYSNYFRLQDVLDYEEWTFNLTLANSQQSTLPPEWYKLYNFIETYDVQNLQAQEIGNLLVRMTQDHALLQKYYRYFIII